MITYNRDYLKELASNCADVEIYVSTGKIGTFHGDFIKFTDLDIDNLPEKEIECIFQEMDEDDYNHSILANSCISADFEDWYDNKEAKVLVIVLVPSFYQSIINSK